MIYIPDIDDIITIAQKRALPSQNIVCMTFMYALLRPELELMKDYPRITSPIEVISHFVLKNAPNLILEISEVDRSSFIVAVENAQKEVDDLFYQFDSNPDLSEVRTALARFKERIKKDNYADSAVLFEMAHKHSSDLYGSKSYITLLATCVATCKWPNDEMMAKSLTESLTQLSLK